MAIAPGIGTRVYIAPLVSEISRTPSAYASLTWTEIGGVESVSEFGDETAGVNFTPLADGRTRTLKGATAPGGLTINCANDPLDAGQLAAVAAAALPGLYPIKIVVADGADANDTDTLFLLGARVMSAKANVGAGGAVNMRAIVLAIDTTILETPSVSVT